MPTLQQNLRFCGGLKTHPTAFRNDEPPAQEVLSGCLKKTDKVFKTPYPFILLKNHKKTYCFVQRFCDSLITALALSTPSNATTLVVPAFFRSL